MKEHVLYQVIEAAIAPYHNDLHFRDEKDKEDTIYDMCIDVEKFIQKLVIEELDYTTRNHEKLKVGMMVIYHGIVHTVTEVTSGYAILTNIKTNKKCEPISAHSCLVVVSVPEEETKKTLLQEEEEDNEPLFDLSNIDEEETKEEEE